MTGHALFRQHGLEFADHLVEHPVQVHGPLLQLQVGEIEAGDVKKFVDQVLQPLRLVQGDTGVPAPKLCRELRFIRSSVR